MMEYAFVLPLVTQIRCNCNDKKLNRIQLFSVHMPSSPVIARYHAGSQVGELIICNPKTSNALSVEVLEELPLKLDFLVQEGARAIVVHSVGFCKNFCSGLDMASIMASQQSGDSGGCQARLRLRFREYILRLQSAMSIFEETHIPIIAAVHGACIGAGLDMITAMDIRVCTESSRFCVKEVDLGIVADMGTLSRLPGLVTEGIARELCLTACEFDGMRAKEIHLVSALDKTEEEMLKRAFNLAKTIASKSPVAVAGTKEVLLWHRDHGNVRDSLSYVATLNASLLPGNEDIDKIMTARKTRKRLPFSKL
jgi:enoyl-CoA hydratase/carnithine racemase